MKRAASANDSSSAATERQLAQLVAERSIRRLFLPCLCHCQWKIGFPPSSDVATSDKRSRHMPPHIPKDWLVEWNLVTIMGPPRDPDDDDDEDEEDKEENEEDEPPVIREPEEDE
jgi:hypothetical protein